MVSTPRTWLLRGRSKFFGASTIFGCTRSTAPFDCRWTNQYYVNYVNPSPSGGTVVGVGIVFSLEFEHQGECFF